MGNRETMHYVVLRQTTDDLRDPENAPGVSMGRYLLEHGEETRLRRISIYQERGTTREAARLLSMNWEGLAVWRAMGRPGVAVEERYRPAKTAELSFGVPYSE